jgi:drug/metabolite transporter (DMT)-like permease
MTTHQSPPYAAQALSIKAAVLLSIPPLLWAGNAIVGRLVADVVPPMTLNLLRWVIAALLLAPFAMGLWKQRQAMVAAWPRLALLGLMGMGCYNSFQYLALKTSTPMNVTLVAASMPVWVLLIGRVFFAQRVSGKAWAGAALSLVGVLVVLLRGDLTQIGSVQLVAGDGWMILATWAWATYSWLLSSPTPAQAQLKGDWITYLMAQMLFGVLWSAAFTSVEWAWPMWQGDTLPTLVWGLPLAGALAYVAVGPALIAYRCWGAGIAIAGASAAGFFANLTPLFAAVLSTIILGEAPHGYHAVAFALIVGGIVVSNRKTKAKA